METFTSRLQLWYKQYQRHLPWRETKNPYKVWLSEIILQQTRIVQGTPYYLKFIEKYPRIYDLANASEDEILKMWQGLGYYSRARNMWHCAKYITHELNGVFPNNYKDLIQLKGIGPYSASAIASICFNEPVATVDGNVIRVLSRFFGVETPTNTSEGLSKIKQLALQVLDTEKPGLHNQALMDFGSIQCKPKGADCSCCTMQKNCVAYIKHKVNILPIKEKKLQIKNLYFNYLVYVDRYQNTIVEQRSNGIWKGLFQFPLLQTEQKASLNDIKKHIYNSDCTIDFIAPYNCTPIIHKLTHRNIFTTFWIIYTNKINDGYPSSEINRLPLPILIANFVEKFSFQEFLLSLEKNRYGRKRNYK